MIPGNDVTIATRRETEKRWRWYKPIRCSICMSFIWLHPIVLKEPAEAPEPRQEWVLCKSCHTGVLMEMHRSSIRSPARLRIAVGLVAAERSPKVKQFSISWPMILPHSHGAAGYFDMENPSQAAVFAKRAVSRVLRASAPAFPLSHP
jgi:hypothetical protein